MISVRTLSASFASVALLIATMAASAETWPARPIKVISPFTAGNAGDTVARIVLDQVSQQIGQPLVIENRPGAGGTPRRRLCRQERSGRVIFHKTLPYDAIRDFAPVSLIGIQPTVVAASPSRDFKTLADLVAAAKAKPGTLTFASAGVGSASHMAAERLRVAAAVDVRHIPFRGATTAIHPLKSKPGKGLGNRRNVLVSRSTLLRPGKLIFAIRGISPA